MTGTVAQTIQGEAGSNPVHQFAVASVIANRIAAGTFPGGTDPFAVVNAPRQFTGFSSRPNASAQAFAAAIDQGTLGQYGQTGNAVNFIQNGSNNIPGSLANSPVANIGGNNFSDRLGPPTASFVAPQYGAVAQDVPGGFNPVLTNPVNPVNPTPPQTTPFDFGIRDVTAGTAFAPNADFSNVPITDSSGNVIGTEATIPPDTIANFGAIDPTAGSPFGGAFNSSGSPIAGSSGIGGLGLPDSFAGGTGGSSGGLGYVVKPAKIASSNEATGGTPIEIPDVANQINQAAQGINTTIGSAGTAFASGLLGGAANAVTSFENWAGNYITRGGTMLIAIVLLAVAFYLLMPRARQAIGS